ALRGFPTDYMSMDTAAPCGGGIARETILLRGQGDVASVKPKRHFPAPTPGASAAIPFAAFSSRRVWLRKGMRTPKPADASWKSRGVKLRRRRYRAPPSSAKPKTSEPFNRPGKPAGRQASSAEPANAASPKAEAEAKALPKLAPPSA